MNNYQIRLSAKLYTSKIEVENSRLRQVHPFSVHSVKVIKNDKNKSDDRQLYEGLSSELHIS